MKVAFDLDGVIYDFIKAFDFHMSTCGVPPINPNTYNIDDRYGVREQFGHYLMDKFAQTRPFKTLSQIERGVEELRNLGKDKSNELFIITYRDWAKFGIEDTLWRLYEDQIPVKEENIIFSNRKGDCARALGIDRFYEDSGENALDIQRNSNAKVYLINKPYNQLVEGKSIKRIEWEKR